MNCLVIVDMQNDFITGALGTPEAEAVVDRVAARAEEGVRRGEALYFTRDTHGPDYLDTQEGKRLPVPHCIRGTAGWELAPQLAACAAGHTPIDKPAFGSTVLGQVLKSRDEDLKKRGLPGVEKVTLVGLCTDICVISNALLLKAFLPETEISVDASCCAGVTPESHKNALAAMRVCQITVENEDA